MSKGDIMCWYNFNLIIFFSGVSIYDGHDGNLVNIPEGIRREDRNDRHGRSLVIEGRISTKFVLYNILYVCSVDEIC